MNVNVDIATIVSGATSTSSSQFIGWFKYSLTSSMKALHGQRVGSKELAQS